MAINIKNNFLINLTYYFIFCFVGSISTIYVVLLGINPIVASSLISIIIAFFTIVINDENHLSWAAFCGSFSGMSSISLISLGNCDSNTINFLFSSIILSGITSILYVLSEMASYKFPKVSFDGYGGRLGTIAFISVLCYFLIGKFFFKAETVIFLKYDFSKSDLWFLFTIPSAIIASIISMEIKNTVSSLNENYKVITVATTGIIGGLLITKIPNYGLDYGLAWYTGAFVGMSSYFVLMFKRHFFLSGLMSGVYFVLTKSLFVGVGGKLGFISFLSVATVKLLDGFYNRILHIREKTPEAIIESLKSGEIKNQTVDDDYAQKLVESLMMAKNSGEQIAIVDENVAGEFVIGEKVNITKYEEQKETEVHNFDYLSPQLREIIHFLNNIEIFSWIYLFKNQNVYSPLSFQGIKNIDKIKFKTDGKFINLIKHENRTIAFNKNGVNQTIFQSRFDIDDLKNTTLLTIFPVFENTNLVGLFIILDKNNNYKNSKNNLKLIKKYFDSISNI